jgi:formamidopyrimidine-DNA glycosylase
VPELPDITVYVERLSALLAGQTLRRLRLRSPFVLRTVDPPIERVEGRTVESIRRLGKRIVMGLEGELFLVIHLMIAGRLHWRPPGAAISARTGLAALDFDAGTLLLTEAGPKKRASLHLVGCAAALAGHDPGGIEVLECDLETFSRRLRRESHTLKRALTDPRILSGIGNAYSDEILHRARLSPLALTGRLSDAEISRLLEAARAVLTEWTDRLRLEAGEALPEDVTAFRPGMAVHGRFGHSCPDCGASVQRIVYADNETDYCPRCQTGGKILADRALSRLLREDWPRSVQELRERGPGGAAAPPQSRAPR